MQALKAVMVVMGVMIVAGTALLAVLIVRRMTPPAAQHPITLNEPAGTRLIGLATTSAGLAVALQGGGPDRILILNPTSLQVTARIAITPQP